jgi:hypothetical protein
MNDKGTVDFCCKIFGFIFELTGLGTSLRVLIFLLGVGAGWAQEQPMIRIVEIEHTGSQLIVTVESFAGEPLSYTLQRSPNLSLGSWLDQDHAILSVLNPSRVILTLPLDDESAGFIRVVASSVSSPVAVVINEVMSNNETTVADGDGDFPDWIELYNASDTAAELTGYQLSDNDANLSEWGFPAGTILDPGQYLVVFASGKVGAEIPEGETHTNFKLSNGNEPVILSDPLLKIVDRLDPGPLVSDNSVGHALDDLETYYVFHSGEPSPGAPNYDFIVDPPEPFVQAPIFSVRGGVFDEPVNLELIPPREGDLIRYTMDGTEPFRGSTPYSGSIELTETTVIRAVVLGAPNSHSVTHTYVMDTHHSLPVMALAADPGHFEFTDGYLYGFGDHMFTSRGNIIGNFPYSASNAWKRNREIEASFEFYEPNEGKTSRMNVGVKIFGGWGSRGYPQKSMALFARREYGYGKIRHPFFPDREVDSFESIVLRNSGNDNQSTWLTYPRPPIHEFSAPVSHGSYFVNGNFTMFRDAMMQSLMAETGLDTQGYRPAVLYLNGDYWGIYNIREKFTEHYLESTHNVSANEIDLIEGYGKANTGSATTYSQMRSFIGGNSMANPSNYRTVQNRYLDIDNFIDYHLAVIYGQNFDIGNIKCWRRRSSTGGQFRWMLYDQDYSFSLWKPDVYLPAMKRDYSDYDNMFDFYTNPRGSGTGWPNSGGRTLLFRKMLENDQFKESLIQRCADLLNTLLASDRVVARIDLMADAIRPEMERHLTRWSWDGIRARGFGIPHKQEDEPLTVAHWERNVESMREFSRTRPDELRRDLIDHFGLPGDTATITITTSDPSKGTVQVNTIEVTETPWSGQYFQEFPPTLTALPKAGAIFVGWSGANTSTETTIQLPIPARTASVTAMFE